MDESQSPLVHRWLTFCRLLMLHHPRVGAESYAIHLGRRRDRYRLGWNVMHPSQGSPKTTRYMYISPEGGRLSPQPPDVPDEELHHIYDDDIPAFRQTLVWKTMLHLQVELVNQNLPQLPAKEVNALLYHIDQFAQNVPPHGDAATIHDLYDEAVQHMKVVAEGPCTLTEFLSPTVEVIRSFWMFDHTGDHASNILALILLYCCTKLPSPWATTTDSDRVWESAEHLCQRTYTLLRERADKTLTAFNDMTYLALLYGNTAMLLYKYLVQSEAIAHKHKAIIEKRCFALDEKITHEAGPSFLHPATYLPFGSTELAHSQKGIKDKSGLYPGAWGVLQGSCELKAVWPAIQAYSARAKEASVLSTIEDENVPVAPVLKRHITEYLLVMDAGRRIKGA